MRQVAAVSELREWIGKQAVKTGAEVVAVSVKSSTTCHICGENVPYQKGLVWNCSSCGHPWDQDENAAANLMRAVQCDGYPS
ncbi:zinc ribbon domain-containing protein [Geobacter sp.]|uniref:zinc ribbon domain-containing protein n=1 Tax=Geobacter sp. TaxID=46610 RepID=UPI0034511798